MTEPEPTAPVSNDSPALQQEPLVQITNLDQFVGIMTLWHKEKVQACKHLLAIPNGSVFEIEGKQLKMHGVTLKGFRLGIELALMQLGELPFEVPAPEPVPG